MQTAKSKEIFSYHFFIPRSYDFQNRVLMATALPRRATNDYTIFPLSSHAKEGTVKNRDK
jgi:hypothetical protein